MSKYLVTQYEIATFSCHCTFVHYNLVEIEESSAQRILTEPLYSGGLLVCMTVDEWRYTRKKVKPLF